MECNKNFKYLNEIFIPIRNSLNSFKFPFHSAETLSHVCCVVSRRWWVDWWRQKEERVQAATITIKTSVLKAFIDIFSRRWYFNNFTALSLAVQHSSLWGLWTWRWSRYEYLCAWPSSSRRVGKIIIIIDRRARSNVMSKRKTAFFTAFLHSLPLVVPEQHRVEKHCRVVMMWRGETASCGKKNANSPTRQPHHTPRAAKAHTRWIELT